MQTKIFGSLCGQQHDAAHKKAPQSRKAPAHCNYIFVGLNEAIQAHCIFGFLCVLAGLEYIRQQKCHAGLCPPAFSTYIRNSISTHTAIFALSLLPYTNAYWYYHPNLRPIKPYLLDRYHHHCKSCLPTHHTSPIKQHATLTSTRRPAVLLGHGSFRGHLLPRKGQRNTNPTQDPPIDHSRP